MLKIGLTGGIGSGKSTAANLFAKFGVTIIDADLIAHDIVKPGLPAYDAIVEHFGKNILNTDKSLNRSKLRELIFSNDTDRKVLENILHPLIRLKINHDVMLVHGEYCIIVIPLMIETGQINTVDHVLLVDAPVEKQIERATLRDGVKPADVEAIIKTQADPLLRRSVSDFVIDNTGSVSELEARVKELHEYFLTLNNRLVDEANMQDNAQQSKINNQLANKQAATKKPMLDSVQTDNVRDVNDISRAGKFDIESDVNERTALDVNNIVYELPLNEKVRTSIRLESLFDEIEFKLQGKTVWDTRAAVNAFIALMNVFNRPEIKTDLMKEIDRIHTVLARFSAVDGVNTGHLHDVQNKLKQIVRQLKAFEGQIGQGLKLNELVMSIRQRDSIPGGALAMDVPNYAHWLSLDIDTRTADIRNWLKEFDLVKSAVTLILQLLRDSAVATDVVAKKGVFQHTLDAGTVNQIVRVILPKGSPYFPEISGGRHRVTVRFLKPMGFDRPVQIEQDVPFKLICCAL